MADNDNVSFNWGIVSSLFLCLFLAACLFLFIRNNHLLVNGGQNLWRAETLVMLGVIGIPFVFTLAHFVRSLRPSDHHAAEKSPQ